ncbi:MAG: hypothetical protein H6726_14965 [Sandaracinaceae bacterium]|nr:hypothetical protein [Sandaracinaceae bacterium]
MTVDLLALRQGVQSHLEAGDRAAAWAVLEPLGTELPNNPELAWLWLDLLGQSPARPTLLAEARVIVEAFPVDPALVIAACDALNRAAERFPMDTPPLRRDGPAHLAAAAADRCLRALPEAERGRVETAGYLHINRANALRMAGADRDAEAQEAFAAALALDPNNGHWWFDLGVLHKWRGRFQEGLDCTLRARSRLGETKAVRWNVAICATALGDGDLAAGVWKALGMPVELQSSGMPLVQGLPPMQVRVLAKGPGTGPNAAVPDASVSFELVWVAPLSPCHGVVQSATFREAPIDFGDVVLWDGAPVSVLNTSDGPVPRFPLLEILRKGDEHRMRFVALSDDPGRIHELEQALPPYARLFVHREHVEVAAPTDEHARPARGDGGAAPEQSGLTYGKIVLPAGADLRGFRAAYEKAIAKRGLAIALPRLYELLEETKRAGQEHQAWRGVERKAIKRGLLT